MEQGEGAGPNPPVPPRQPSYLRWAARAIIRQTIEPVPVRTAAPSMVLVKVASLAVTFASSILIARLLGPTDKGIYNAIVLLPIMYCTLLEFGASNGNILYLSRGELRLNAAYGNAVAQVVITLALVGVPFVLFAGGSVETVFPGVPAPWLAASILALGPLALHGLLGNGLFIGTDRATATFALPLLMQIMLLAGASIAAMMGSGLTGVATAYLVAAVFVQILYAAYFLRRDAWPLSIQPKLGIRSIRFGLPLFTAGILSMALSRLDQIFVIGALGPAALGQYALAVALGEMLWSLDLPVTTAMVHAVASRSEKDAAALVQQASRLVVLGMGAACLCAAVVVPFVLPLLYGEAFRPAVSAFLAYLPAVFFMSIGRVLAQDLAYQHKRNGLVLAANAVSVALNLALLALLLSPMGIVGASLASSCAYLLLMLIFLQMYRRLTGARVADLLVPRSDDVSLGRNLVATYLAKATRRPPKNNP